MGNQEVKTEEMQLKSFTFDKDPANWSVNCELQEYVAKFGFYQNDDCDFSSTKQVLSNKTLHLCQSHFVRKLTNGECQQRNWLVSSPKLNRVFCGPCRLFREEHNNEALLDREYEDWHNVKMMVVLGDLKTACIKARDGASSVCLAPVNVSAAPSFLY